MMTKYQQNRKLILICCPHRISYFDFFFQVLNSSDKEWTVVFKHFLKLSLILPVLWTPRCLLHGQHVVRPWSWLVRWCRLSVGIPPQTHVNLIRPCEVKHLFLKQKVSSCSSVFTQCCGRSYKLWSSFKSYWLACFKVHAYINSSSGLFQKYDMTTDLNMNMST